MGNSPHCRWVVKTLTLFAEARTMHKTMFGARLAAALPSRQSKVCVWRGADGRYFWTAPYRDGSCPQADGAQLVARRYPGHPWEMLG